MTRFAVQQRLDLVTGWLADRLTTRQIVVLMGEMSVAPSTARRYVQLATRVMEARLLEDRETMRAKFLTALQDDVEVARQAGAHGAVAATRNIMAKVIGAFAPEQHEHKVAAAVVHASAAEFDLTQLTDDELDVVDGAAVRVVKLLPATVPDVVVGKS